MKKYKVLCSVDGKSTEQIVSANSPSDARKIVEKQFNGSRVVIFNVQDTSTGFYN